MYYVLCTMCIIAVCIVYIVVCIVYRYVICIVNRYVLYVLCLMCIVPLYILYVLCMDACSCICADMHTRTCMHVASQPHQPDPSEASGAPLAARLKRARPWPRAR